MDSNCMELGISLYVTRTLLEVGIGFVMTCSMFAIASVNATSPYTSSTFSSFRNTTGYN